MAQAIATEVNNILTSSVSQAIEAIDADFEKLIDINSCVEIMEDKLAVAVEQITENLPQKIETDFSQIINGIVEETAGEISLDITLDNNLSEETETETNSNTEDCTPENQNNTQIGEKELEINDYTNDALFMSQTNTFIQDFDFNELNLTNPDDECTTSKTENTLQTSDLFTNQNPKKAEKLEFISQENINSKEKSIEDIVDKHTLEELNVETVETSNDTSSSDLMQNQTPQEQGVKVMLGINDSNISNTNTAQNFEKLEAQIVSSNKIIEQITKQLEGMSNSSKVNIVLNPEALGKVSLQIMNTKNGLSAIFTVTTQDAKNLLMNGLDSLRENLLAQGVSVDNVSVKLNETQESEYNADWTEQEGSKGGYKREQHSGEKNKEQDFETMLTQNKEETKS